MWRCTVHTDGGARSATDQMCAVARYYDISSKADRGDIFMIHDQKSSYRTPLVQLMKKGGKNKSVAFIILFSIHVMAVSVPFCECEDTFCE